MKLKALLSIVALLAAFCVHPREIVNEEKSPQPPVLGLSVKTDPGTVNAPGEAKLTFSITVPRGYHIFGGEEMKVSVLSSKLRVKSVKYPKPETEDGFDIYRGTFLIPVEVSITEPVNGEIKGELKLDWQGCQDFGDKVCFMPTTSKASFTLIAVAEPAAAKPPQDPDAAAAPPPETAAPAARGEFSFLKGFKEKGRFAGFLPPSDFRKWFDKASSGQASTEKENLFSKVAKNNIPLAILVAILFGFLSSLTPCVYPVIPVTIAYIGNRASGKGKLSGFVLSLFFVLGLALVYSALGVASSLLGVSFGSLTQKPLVGLFVALVFLLLGLSMMGLFEIAMPSKWSGRIEAEKRKGKGYLGAFFIGALSGLVASPCIGPLLLAILVIVASIGSALLGFIYLFAFAVGMGILFILIGTFSGLLSSLPKSGGWMDFVKIVFGALIIAAAFYFGALYLSAPPFFLLSGLVVGFLVAFMFFGASRHFLPVPARIVGSLLVIAAFAGILPFTRHMPGRGRETAVFETNLPAAAAKAAQENKPLLLDFRADWCAACLELEEKTWPSEEAGRIFSGLIPVKIDLTKESEARSYLEAYFKIKGLPTVILLDPVPEGKADGKDTGD